MFEFLGKKHVLVPLSLKEAYANQVKIKEAIKGLQGCEPEKKNESKEAFSEKRPNQAQW